MTLTLNNRALINRIHEPDLVADMEEANRIPISVLLPEQFSHALSLSVDRRTPVLDLLVYVASLFRFNPSDYTLGYVDPLNEAEFRILRPNSCVGAAGSSVLRVAHKKQVMSNLADEGACLRHAYSDRHKPICAKRFTAPVGISLDVPVHVILPDGHDVLISQPEEITLGQLLLRVCDKYMLDPNRYLLQPSESMGNDVAGLACSNSRVASWKNRTFHMVPALKACNLAESESSVDRMSQLAESQFRQRDWPQANSLPMANAAVKALAAGTMMPDVTDGLGLNEREFCSFAERKVLEEKPKKTFSSVDKYYNDIHRLSVHGSYQQRVYYPQRQNALEVVCVKSTKKQRAPLPPGSSISNKERTYHGNLGKHSLQLLTNGPVNHHRDGRVHSACSTLDDISEDFRQAIQLGSTMSPGHCDKAAQTVDFVRAKPFLISQEIQTGDDLLQATDKFEYCQTESCAVVGSKREEPRQRQLPLHHLTTIIKENEGKCRHVEPFHEQSSQKEIAGMVFRETSTQCEQPVVVAPALTKPRKKHFLYKIHGKGSHSRGCQNVAAIIADQERVAPFKRNEQSSQEGPVQLEVTEKTTTVECTVTVLTEGKSLSAVKKPLTVGPDVLGPRPYSKKLEFRKLNSEDSCSVAGSGHEA